MIARGFLHRAPPCLIMADLPAPEGVIAKGAYVPQILKWLLTAHLIELESATLATVPDSVGLGGSTPSPLAHWKVNSWVRREDVFVVAITTAVPVSRSAPFGHPCDARSVSSKRLVAVELRQGSDVRELRQVCRLPALTIGVSETVGFASADP
jgi:hypothetical protein